MLVNRWLKHLPSSVQLPNELIFILQPEGLWRAAVQVGVALKLITHRTN